MNDHWFAGLLRGLQVQAEGFLLQLRRFRLVVIIQAGFTNRHHTRMIELMQQPIQRWRSARLHVQRVHANRTVDIVITLGQGFDVGGVVDTDADTQKVPDSTLAGRVERGIQRAVMGGEVKAIKVTMGIYEHKRAATYIV
jgi:hypothetical protein